MIEETELIATDDSLFETDEQRLLYTQNMRKRIVTEMIADGIPKEKGDKMVVLTALADIDRAALGNKRITTASKEAQEDRNAAMIIAKLSQVRFQTPSGSPFEAPVIDGEFREIPALNEANMPALVLAPGETEIGISTRTYDEFMNDTR